MARLLQAIGDILRPEVIKRDNPIVLREEHPDSSCEPVTLKKTGQALVVKPDDARAVQGAPNAWLFPLLRPEAGALTVMCDYIVFYPAPGRAGAGCLFVFLCELKSNHRKGALAQVQNGCLLSEYILAMARHHGEVHEDPAVHYRGLIFSTRAPSPKGAMKPGTPPPYSIAPRMERLPYIYLRCGYDGYHLNMFCKEPDRPATREVDRAR